MLLYIRSTYICVFNLIYLVTCDVFSNNKIPLDWIIFLYSEEGATLCIVDFSTISIYCIILPTMKTENC